MDRGVEILGLRFARAMIAGALALAALVMCAPAAWGQPIAVKGGEARLTIDGGLRKALRQDGVAIKPLAATKLKGSRLTLAVKRGSFEPDASAGSFALAGGLKLVAGGRSVALRQLELDSTSRIVSAKLAGKRVALAQLGDSDLEREGFRVLLAAKRLPLTRTAALLLNRMLAVPVLLRAGRSLGSVDALGEGTEFDLSNSRIMIASASGTSMAKLEANKVGMGLSGGTEAWGNPLEEPQRGHVFLFEVQPSRIATDASSGVVESAESDGFIMQTPFRSPPGDLLFRHPRIDLATGDLSATFSSLSREELVTATIATLDLGAGKLQIRPRLGAIELTGIPAVSNQFLADQLNERLRSTGLLAAGETFARLTLELRSGYLTKPLR